MALTDQELLALLADFESDRVERKESAGDRDKLSQAICAFANDLPGHGKPGVLFVGVIDRGSSSGLRITDELLRTLADLRDQGSILPPPSMSVRKVTAPIGDVAVVEVQPSTAPPVRYKGRIYIRVGPRRGIANLGVIFKRGTFKTILGVAGARRLGWWVGPTARAGQRTVRCSRSVVVLMGWLRYRPLGQTFGLPSRPVANTARRPAVAGSAF